MKAQRYRDVLSHEIGARIVVEFTTPVRGREVVDYAVILRRHFFSSDGVMV